MTEEKWAPVRGRMEEIEVSTWGRVREVGKEGFRKQSNARGYRSVRVKVYSPRRHALRDIPWGSQAGASDGNDIAYTMLVHRLVAAAFLRRLGEGDVINHKDGDKSNNHLENLEIVDVRENAAHASRMGLVPPGARRGDRHPRAILSEEGVREIRESTERLTHLAWKYGVGVGAIRKIKLRETWAHVK